MIDTIAHLPVNYNHLVTATKDAGFTMPSDEKTGSLLRTLVASKPNGLIIELGTGTGLATTWILEGMNKTSQLITIDNNERLLEIAKSSIPDDRVIFVLEDAYQWIKKYSGKKADLIFADAMPGKYDLLDETLAFLNIGGLYVIDDMLPQPNWPKGHDMKVRVLLENLEARPDLVISKLAWSTGIVIATKISEK